MNDIQLKDDFYEWTGNLEILKTSYFKVTLKNSVKIIGIETDFSSEGVIILGKVEAIVDSLVFTKSHGAVGNTISFSGTNLVIVGLTIADLQEYLAKSELTKQDYSLLKDEADSMISKLNKTIGLPKTSITLDHEDEMEYIIFGKRNFFLITSKNKFVFVHNNQIAIRKGESKLVQIDHQDGILIAERDKVLNIGGSISTGRSMLGEFGVNIANSILENILWD